MKRPLKLTSALLGIFLTSAVLAQTPMNLDEAINTALSKNYTVLVSRNNVEVSNNLATPGQAGMLPTVSGNGSIDYGSDDVRLQIKGSPDIQETLGASSLNMNASIGANYTLFSGGKNQRTYDQLVLRADLSDAQSRVEIEGILMQVISSYYNVLRAQDNLAALSETKQLSRERLRFSERQRDLSGGSKLNVLSAQVDLNKDSVEVFNAQQALEAASITFNQLLGRDLETPLTLVPAPEAEAIEEYSKLKTTMLSQNWQVKSARMNLQSSVLDYKIARSSYIPKLDLNASYSYARAESEGSFLKYNQSNGWGVMLSLNIPIYAGGTRKAAVNNTQIQTKNQELLVKNTELSLESGLRTAYTDYQNALNIVSMEEQNVQLNEENFEYTAQQYELGLVTNTQFREAQINLLLTKNSLNNVRYNLRLAELELKRLTGGLVELL